MALKNVLPCMERPKKEKPTIKGNDGHKKRRKLPSFRPAITVLSQCYVKRLIQSSKFYLESKNSNKNFVKLAHLQ